MTQRTRRTLSYYKKKFGAKNVWKLSKDKKGFKIAVAKKNKGKIQRDIDTGKMKIIPHLKILVRIK